MNGQSGSRLIKNSVLTIFNTVFMLATSWIISIWVARQLGPTNYGIFNLVLWLSGSFTWILGMGLVTAVTKFVAEADASKEANPTAIVLFVLRIEILLSLVTTVIVVFFCTPIADYFFSPNESIFYLIAFLGIVPGMITAIFSAAIEGIQKFEYFTVANLILTPLSFASKVAVLLLGLGITGLLYVMLIFSFVNCVFYWIVLKKEGFFSRQGHGRLAPDIRKRMLRYNTSVTAILLCDKIVWDKSENFFLGRFRTAADTGFYNLAYNVAQKLMTTLPNTFWKVLFPAMSRYFGADEKTKMRRLFFVATRYLAFISFPVGVAGAILAYRLILYLYGYQYVAAQKAMQIIFLTSIVSSLSKPASAILYGFEKQSFVLKYGSFLAVVNIVLDIFLIRDYGAVGAAMAYGITTILGSVGGVVYTCRTMHLRYPIASVFKVLFATVVMAIVMEFFVLKWPTVSGFVAAIVLGTVVYLVGALVLGTFEAEDYALLESVKVVLPPRGKRMVDAAIGLIMQFKTERPD